MDPMAVKAVGDHSMGIPRRKASAVIAHTARTGFIRVNGHILGFTGFSSSKECPMPVM